MNFRYLWGSSASSTLADGILLAGAPLLAITMTRSPSLVSLVSMAMTLPWLLLALHAGAIADRLDRRRIMVVANVLRAAALGITAAASAVDLLTVPVLIAIMLICGTAEVFADTAAQSVLPMVVPADRLSTANGRLFATQTVGHNFAGAPVAGVLVGVLPVAVFGAPALLYGAAGLLLLGMRGRFRTENVSTKPLRADIGEGLRYLAGHRVIRSLSIWSGMVNLANSAFFAVFVLWAVGPHSRIGVEPGLFGLVTSVLAVGAILGSLVATRVAAMFGEGPTIVVASLVNALLLLMPVLVPTVWSLFVAAPIIGATNTMTNVIGISLRQRVVPERLLARVNSAGRLIGMGGAPLGALGGGLLGELAGLPAVFYTAVGICVSASVLLWRNLAAAKSAPVPEPAPAAA
ncbi:MFS transporter [Microtetraspora malaysiensis]|uniref:MFS transporter n=1 Tax=Microtetraspora malaysiensis TaxID=161358 RepID=A0ABW6SVA4_9ACTN